MTKQSKVQQPDEQPDDKKVILLQDKETGRVSGALNVKDKPVFGNLTPGNRDSLYLFGSQGNFFSNFLKALQDQFKNPDRYEIYTIPEKILSGILSVTDETVKIIFPNKQNEPSMQIPFDEEQPTPQTPELKPEDAPEQKPEDAKLFPIPDDKIDWKALQENWGISKEDLKKLGQLDDLYYGRRTKMPLNVNLNVDGGHKISIEGKLQLRYESDHKAHWRFHGLKSAPKFNQAYYGHTFSEEDKKNILSPAGNMGRIVSLKFENKAEAIPCLISRDTVTNDLLYMPAQNIRVPNELKGVKLSDDQKTKLLQGEAVFSENFISSAGKPFAAYVQYNTEKKGFAFQFPDRLTIGKKLCDVPLSAEQQADLKAGKPVFLKNMLDKRSGERIDRYVKADFKQNKFHFSEKPFKSEITLETKPPKNDKTKGLRV